MFSLSRGQDLCKIILKSDVMWLLRNLIQSEVTQPATTWFVARRCLNVGGKTCHITIQLIFLQCFETSCPFLLPFLPLLNIANIGSFVRSIHHFHIAYNTLCLHHPNFVQLLFLFFWVSRQSKEKIETMFWVQNFVGGTMFIMGNVRMVSLGNLEDLNKDC